MKKLCCLIIVVVALLLFNFSNDLRASLTQQVQLNVVIYNSAVLSISNLGGSTLDMGACIADRTNCIAAQRAILQNNGNMLIDIGVSASSSDFTLVTGMPGSDQLRLFGIFKTWDSDITKTDLASNDVITGSSVAASATAFANDSDPDVDKGFNVPVLSEKSLKFALQPGTSSTPNTTLSIMITATAIESVP